MTKAEGKGKKLDKDAFRRQCDMKTQYLKDIHIYMYIYKIRDGTKLY
jgi:hypothetical protein